MITCPECAAALHLVFAAPIPHFNRLAPKDRIILDFQLPCTVFSIRNLARLVEHWLVMLHWQTNNYRDIVRSSAAITIPLSMLALKFVCMRI